MNNSPTLEEVELWLKHPKVHKAALAKALSDGLLLKIFNNEKTSEELRKKLMEQLPAAFKSLDTDSLLKGYGALAGMSSKRVKICTRTFNKEFIRKPPSKRMPVC